MQKKDIHSTPKIILSNLNSHRWSAKILFLFSLSIVEYDDGFIYSIIHMIETLLYAKDLTR